MDPRSALAPQVNAGSSHWNTALEPRTGALRWSPTLEHYAGTQQRSTTMEVGVNIGGPPWNSAIKP